MDRITSQPDPRLRGERIRGERIYNGMPAAELGSEGWHKPWSGGNGATAWRR